MINTFFFDIGKVVTTTSFKDLYSNFAERIGISHEFVDQYIKDNESLFNSVDLIMNSK